MRILYEDAHCLAVAKPAGTSTQAPPIAGPTLQTAVQAYLNPQEPQSVYLGTVHRLDRPVSGVVLWAKTPRAARHLSRQFERRRVQKVYWAVVERGRELDGPLWQDWIYREETGLGHVQVCRPETPRAQRALTRVEAPDSRGIPEGCSWLVLRPETGRTHQLRVQASARGMPILGDRLYGSTRDFPDGIALHARALTVLHPETDQPVTFTAPLPESWAQAGLGPFDDGD